MRMMTLLIVSGGLLLTLAAPVNAHNAGHHDYDRQDRHYYSIKRRSEMPRWLKRHQAFRHWYKRSPNKRRQSLSWARLFEIYRWEHRHARRHDNRRHYARYDDDRERYRVRRKRD